MNIKLEVKQKVNGPWPGSSKPVSDRSRCFRLFECNKSCSCRRLHRRADRHSGATIRWVIFKIRKL